MSMELNLSHPHKWISPGILVIAAPTPYIRDWLTSRLTATLFSPSPHVAMLYPCSSALICVRLCFPRHDR